MLDKESSKLFYDLFKHLTMLSSGSILLILALVEKLFKASEMRWLIGAALLLFLVSIVTSLCMMLFYASVAAGRQPNADFTQYMTRVLWIAGSSFVFGIFSIAVFTVANVYSSVEVSWQKLLPFAGGSFIGYLLLWTITRLRRRAANQSV